MVFEKDPVIVVFQAASAEGFLGNQQCPPVLQSIPDQIRRLVSLGASFLRGMHTGEEDEFVPLPTKGRIDGGRAAGQRRVIRSDREVDGKGVASAFDDKRPGQPEARVAVLDREFHDFRWVNLEPASLRVETPLAREVWRGHRSPSMRAMYNPLPIRPFGSCLTAANPARAKQSIVSARVKSASSWCSVRCSIPSSLPIR